MTRDTLPRAGVDTQPLDNISFGRFASTFFLCTVLICCVLTVLMLTLPPDTLRDLLFYSPAHATVDRRACRSPGDAEVLVITCSNHLPGGQEGCNCSTFTRRKS